jgi:Dihydroneopterin aldolase
MINKTVEESSFETLESLATHLSKRVIKYFIYPYSPGQEIFSQVRICLEKPSAIMFADAPAIEIIRSSDPSLDVESKKLYEEWFQNDDEHEIGAFRPGIPFPLQGRLDEWIEEMCPEDTTGVRI